MQQRCVLLAEKRKPRLGGHHTPTRTPPVCVCVCVCVCVNPPRCPCLGPLGSTLSAPTATPDASATPGCRPPTGACTCPPPPPRSPMYGRCSPDILGAGQMEKTPTSWNIQPLGFWTSSKQPTVLPDRATPAGFPPPPPAGVQHAVKSHLRCKLTRELSQTWFPTLFPLKEHSLDRISRR